MTLDRAIDFLLKEYKCAQDANEKFADQGLRINDPLSYALFMLIRELGKEQQNGKKDS